MADLALGTLIFMNSKGSSGLLLPRVRQHFKNHPEHLRELARYSLECGTLITPTLVPEFEGNYQRYKIALNRWIALRNTVNKRSFAEKDVEACRIIHEDLLDTAEDVSYPTTLYLLEMLSRSVSDSLQPWQKVWQHYLVQQLDSLRYIAYQNVVLLWLVLFPEKQALEVLGDHVLMQYNAASSIHLYAQRLLTTLTTNLLYKVSSSRRSEALVQSRDPRTTQRTIYMLNSAYLAELKKIDEIPEEPRPGIPIHLGDIRYMRRVKYMESLLGMRVWDNSADLEALLFVRDTANKAIERLSNNRMSLAEQVDLLTILKGRMLQIVVNKEKGIVIEQEIQNTIQAACMCLALSHKEVFETALDVIRYLPMRTGDEVMVVVRIAEGTADERIHEACASALMNGQLKQHSAEVRAALEEAIGSRINVVKEAAQQVLNSVDYRWQSIH